MKTKWRKAIHISLALNNKWLFFLNDKPQISAMPRLLFDCWVDCFSGAWLLNKFLLPPLNMICIIYCMHSVPEKRLPTEIFIETTGLKLASRHSERQRCVASRVSMATAVVHFTTSLPSWSVCLSPTQPNALSLLHLAPSTRSWQELHVRELKLRRGTRLGSQRDERKHRPEKCTVSCGQ